MKVLMTADTVGGVWTYALDLTRSLAGHGVHVSLATMGALPTEQQRQEAEQLPNLTLYPSPYKLEWMEEPWEDLERAGEWLMELEAAVAPDLVHLNNYVHGALAWKTPVLMVGHSCVLSWWEAVKGEPAPERWSRYRAAVARGLKAARVVVAPTKAMLNCLERHYGPLRSIKGVIANGRESSLYSPCEKEPFVLTAGRLWDEAKNVPALESIASRLSWPVYVAGEERHPDGGGQVSSQALRPLGRLAPEELAHWYSRASIYALPARYEPFGLSALEAALSGCALVLGDIASLREVWGEDTALYVSPDDGEALAGTIEQLISSPQKRQQLAACARQRARGYGLERMGGQYLKLYQCLRGACGLV